MPSTWLGMPWANRPSSLSYDLPRASWKCGQRMRCRYSNKSPVYPSKTVLAMLHSTCSEKNLWEILYGLTWWLEVLTACKIISWLIECLCAALPRVLYDGASVFFYSVACWYYTTSTGTSVGLFCTLVGKVWNLVPGESLFTIRYAVAVGMAAVVVVVSVGIVKKSVSCSKSSIWISLCKIYPWNDFSKSFSDFNTASDGVTVGWVRFFF